ncbi:MAG: hypothetical protein WD607_00250 [Candidatus Paceibacterota bacterium]
MYLTSKIYSSVVLLVIGLSLNAQQISENLVGTNVWYYDPGSLVWELTKECGVQTIRIGGHAYDKNLPHKDTLLSWVKKIQMAGADAVVQVSQYQSAEAAAEIVRYLNIEKQGEIKPVKYWNIGNEPWLQAGKPELSSMGNIVEAYFKPIATAMKEVDPTIKIYGPNFCDFLEEPISDLFGGNNDITIKVPGKNYHYCDGLAFHRYPQGNGDPAVEGANDILERIVKAKAKIDEVNLKSNRTGDDALIWGIGEFNSKGGSEVHTWGNGQMFGAVLGWCMEYQAKFATSWSMFEHGGSRKGTDFSLIDGANMFPRASYRHMQFVANHFKGEFLKGTQSDSAFMVYGASENGKISVMIMNRGFGENKNYTLFLNNEAKCSDGIFFNVDAKIDDFYKGNIESRSTQVLIFEGDSIMKINYTSADFDNERLPERSKFLNTNIRNKPAGAIDKREKPNEKKYVNLEDYYNFSIHEEIHQKPGNIVPIPSGISDFNGVVFDVRGIVQLASKVSYEKSHIHYPAAIEGISVGAYAKELCFLHSLAWDSPKGTEVAQIVVHYANNEIRTIMLKSKEEVEDWWFHLQNSVFPVKAELAWEGTNERVNDLDFVIKLYKYTWKNPLPDVEIKSIDLVSSMNDSGYMLYALTCL